MHVRLTVRKLNEHCCVCVMTDHVTVPREKNGEYRDPVLSNHRSQKRRRGKGTEFSLE